MYVRLNTLMAGPQGTAAPGTRILCSAEVGQELIKSGQATAADGDGGSGGTATATASVPEDEDDENDESNAGGSFSGDGNPEAIVGNVTITHKSPVEMLERLGVDSRYVSAAQRAGHQYVGDVVRLPLSDLEAIDGISKKGALQIQAAANRFE